MTLDQQFSESTLRTLREAVLAYASAAGMPEGRAVDVVIAAHELAANAVRHGGGTGRVRMQVTGGKLICQVSDPGPAGPDGRHRGATAARAQPWPVEPGHGLWLVRLVADDVAVSSGPAGSQVRIVLALSPGELPGGLAGSGIAR